MRFAISALLAALLMAFGAPASAEAPAREAGFRTTMDRVFGPAGWRQTSGFRTPAQEDALRRQGAGAVPPGRRSSHSTGTPHAPGAYDAVVPGMSQVDAAARLRRAPRPFARVVAERRHGPQGAHLHIELQPGRGAGPAICERYRGEVIHERIVNGRRNPLIECEARWRAQNRAPAPRRAAPEGLLD